MADRSDRYTSYARSGRFPWKLRRYDGRSCGYERRSDRTASSERSPPTLPRRSGESEAVVSTVTPARVPRLIWRRASGVCRCGLRVASRCPAGGTSFLHLHGDAGSSFLGTGIVQNYKPVRLLQTRHFNTHHTSRTETNTSLLQTTTTTATASPTIIRTNDRNHRQRSTRPKRYPIPSPTSLLTH